MRISAHQQARFLQAILKENLLAETDESFHFFDFDLFDSFLNQVKSAMPKAKHAVAIKTNPLPQVLQHIAEKGFSAEAASFQEVQLALDSGFEAENIIFDGPAKTQTEILALKSIAPEVYINADCLEEADEINALWPEKKLGLRIGFEGKGSEISSMNVSGQTSKFGEFIKDLDQAVDQILNRPFIRGLHLHAGSQINDFSPFVFMLKKGLDLASRVNSKSVNQILNFDIGGGHPVNYKGDPFSFSGFSDLLKSESPELFNFQVLTEYGRFYHAHAGFTCSRIHRVKNRGKSRQIIVHLGADSFLREAYNPEDWYHDMAVADEQGNLKSGPGMPFDIGGPLCFGGDYLTKNQDLPNPRKGDYLLISDTGANTFALWSRHCSRPFPKVIGYKNGEIFILRSQEEYREIYNFWKGK